MFKIILLIITVLYQTILSAQLNWSNINGPTGGEFEFVCVTNSSELFAASKGESVFLSSDHGATWMKRNNGLNTRDFTSLLSNNDNTYISAYSSGVYRYNVNGGNWIQINMGLSNAHILTIASDSSGTLYAGGYEGDIFRLIAGSDIWELIYSFELSEVRGFHIDKENNFYVVIKNFTPPPPLFGGLFKSNDGGTSWLKISPDSISIQNIGDNSITTDLYGNIYFSFLNNILRSSDSGVTWDNIYTFADDFYIFYSCSNLISITDNQLFGSIRAGRYPSNEQCIFHSQNQGQTWEEKGLNSFDLYKLAYDSLNNSLFVATSKGIFKSIDFGNSWIDINSNMDALSINDLISDQSGSIYISTPSGVYNSLDKGDTWVSLFDGLPTFFTSRIAHFDSSLYAYSMAGVYTFNQNYKRWIQLSQFQAFDLDQDEFGNLYMCGYDFIMKSQDNGITWQIIFPDKPFESIEVLQDSIILAATSPGTNEKIYRSTNLGSTWAAVRSSNASKFYYNEDSLVIATGTGSLSRSARSTDLGLTWEALSLTQGPNYYIYDVTFINKNEIYVSAKNIDHYSPSIFYSSDYGNSWFDLGSPGNVNFLEYSTYDSILYTGYSTSIYRAKINVTSVELTEFVNLNEMNLYQNYPNPFNPITIINYALKDEGLVKIKVFDILGSEVAELVNETKAAGEHFIEFKAGNLPSGVYFYTLQVNGYSGSKKMLLLK